MDFFYTKHQVQRGTRADAEIGEKLYLIKSTSNLRLTYQIRLLAYMAESRKKKLIIRLPKDSTVHEILREFIHTRKNLITIERT